MTNLGPFIIYLQVRICEQRMTEVNANVKTTFITAQFVHFTNEKKFWNVPLKERLTDHRVRPGRDSPEGRRERFTGPGYNVRDGPGSVLK